MMRFVLYIAYAALIGYAATGLLNQATQVMQVAS